MKHKEEYTPWYPANISPSVPGVYQVKICGMIGYAYWNGRKFGWRSFDVKTAFYDRNRPTNAGDTAVWRGLTRQSAMEIRNEI